MASMEEVRYLVLAAQRQGERALTILLKDLHVTPSQAEALRVLADHGPLSLKELGERLICEGGSPSRLLTSLIEKGLVVSTENEKDRRVKSLVLSKRGLAVAHQIKEQEKKFYAQYEVKMSYEQLSAITHAMNALVDDPRLARALKMRGITPNDEEND